MSEVANLFTDEGGQVIRLPEAFRSKGKEVLLRKDPKTGDVIVSPKPGNWDGFFTLLKENDRVNDFLDTNEPDVQQQERDPFEGWSE